jgi:hypothetical protein
MSTAGISEAPIHARLVQEKGDVPAEVGRAAERILREVREVLTFHLPAPPGPGPR